jgi:DNA methylase
MRSAGLSTNNQTDVNKLLPQDRPAHDWYRFVLSFPPHLVRTYLQRFGIKETHVVLDPFCGTGTTLVECKKLGISGIAVEANPMGHFATRVKTDWTPDADGLIAHSQRVAERAASVLGDGNGAALRRLPEDKENLLLGHSISPVPLHKTLVLLECLDRELDNPYHAHERLALAKAIVHSISNLHFGPEVGVGPPKPDAPVIASWQAQVHSMAEDLRELTKFKNVFSEAYRADSRELLRVLKPESVDAVITSPPYPNEKDYTRTTRLESVLLGMIRSKADLRDLKKSLVRSNTRGVYKGDDDDDWVARHPEVQRIAEAIEARRLELRKTSGFERLYARVTKLYFGGMARHLADLRLVLRPGARLAYVVGDQAPYLRVMIRTGQLIADLAQSLGYEPVGVDLFRTRLATATKEQLREEVLVLHWPGKR